MPATTSSHQAPQPACAGIISAALFYRLAWCEAHPALMLVGAAVCAGVALAMVAP